MMPWRLPNLWIYTLAVFKPRSLRPDLFAPSVARIDWHALRAQGFNTVVIDKDNCLTIPDRDELYPDFKTGWDDLKEAFGPSRVLVVSNSAGTKKDVGGVGAESVSRKLGVPVLVHKQPKPGCSHDIMSNLQGYTTLDRIQSPHSTSEMLGTISDEQDLSLEIREREEWSLLGNKRLREHSRSDEGVHQHEGYASMASKSDVEMIHRTSQVEPLRIIVVGDRLATDVLLAGRLRKHVEAFDKELRPDGAPSILSIITTDLPQHKDVRLLRWLESGWSGIGRSQRADQISKKWSAFIVQPESGAMDNTAAGSERRSILTGLRALGRIRSWRPPTRSDVFAWISLRSRRALAAGWIQIRSVTFAAWRSVRGPKVSDGPSTLAQRTGDLAATARRVTTGIGRLSTRLRTDRTSTLPAARTTVRAYSTTPPEVDEIQAKIDEVVQEAKQDQEQMGLQSTDLLEVYQSLVTRGILKFDEAQVRCVMELRKLLVELQDYSPPLDLVRNLSPDAPALAQAARAQPGKSWFKALMNRKSPSPKSSNSAGDRERALVRVLSGEEELSELTTPKGILLTGPPGTGKSYLLGLFFSLLPTTHKARHHYHPFLLSLYQQVWRRTQARMASATEVIKEDRMDKAGKEGWRSIFAGGAYGSGDGRREEEDTRRVSLTGQEERESISFGIAKDMILEYHILYFDELQLVDASSASLLRDILSWYWRLGGVIIATSNRLPDDLYHHGVQRERMASFLEALKSRCTVYEVNGGRDFRLGDGSEDMTGRRKKWFGTEERAEFEDSVKEATGGEQGVPTSVNVYGRKVRIPWAVGNTARFTFAELCEEALATADYISICSRFETIIIDEMPLLYLKHKNQARRLINLVDALYESRCKVIIQAEARPEDLFFPDALDDADDMSENNEAIMAAEALTDAVSAPFRPNVSVYEAEGVASDAERSGAGDAARIFRRKASVTHPSEETSAAFKSLSIFTGEDERFAYRRAVSRLIEMSRSPIYDTQEWLPVSESHRRWESHKLTVPPPLPAFFREQEQVQQETTQSPPTATSSSRPSEPFSAVAPATSGEDFADEAGYSRPTGGRSGPPVIAESHVWGVRDDWGPRAGTWGQGAKGKGRLSDESKGGKKGERSMHTIARRGLHLGRGTRAASQATLPKGMLPPFPPGAPLAPRHDRTASPASTPITTPAQAPWSPTSPENPLSKADTEFHIDRLHGTAEAIKGKLDRLRAKQRDVGFLISAGGGDEAERQARKLDVRRVEYERVLTETEKELDELRVSLRKLS